MRFEIPGWEDSGGEPNSSVARPQHCKDLAQWVLCGGVCRGGICDEGYKMKNAFTLKWHTFEL